MGAYDNIAWFYKRFYHVFFDKKLILRFLKDTFLEYDVSKEAKILDVGCGTGFILRSLARAGFKRLYGIDISEQMIKIACVTNSSFNVKLYNENFLDFSPRNKFDVVLSTTDVLNHISRKDLLRYFRNVKRILKSDGLFIFDINLEEYFRKVRKRKKVIKRVDDVLFIWNFNTVGKKIFIDFSIKDKNTAAYDRVIEYVYSEREIEEFLEKNGFTVVKKVYDYKSPFKNYFYTKVCYVCKKFIE